MTKRIINQIAAGVLDTDLLTAQRVSRYMDGWLARALVGADNTTDQQAFLAGFHLQYPPGIAIEIDDGVLFTPTMADDAQYGSLPASALPLRAIAYHAAEQHVFAAPVGAGTSINYLVYGTYASVDGDPRILYYYNADNPTQVFRGVGNAGTTTNTTRTDTFTLSYLAGAAAATGTQATPAVPAGGVPLYVVTVPYGLSQLGAGNVSQPTSAPFLAGLTNSHHSGGLGQAPKILIGTEIPASDTVGAIGAVQTYAGNPNGSVAGAAGAAGGLPPSMCWDITNAQMWVCTATGNAANAVWAPTGHLTQLSVVSYAGSSGSTPIAGGQVVPAGARLAYVEAVAGGGPGGSGNTGAGGGGAGGAGVRGWIPVTGGQAITGSVGGGGSTTAGGTGGTAATGTQLAIGGTSILALTPGAGGALGGSAIAAGSTSFGMVTSAYAALMQFAGESGQNGALVAQLLISGDGGASMFGPGGKGSFTPNVTSAAASGAASTFFGGGGSGATGSGTGAPGQPGLIRLTFFY